MPLVIPVLGAAELIEGFLSPSGASEPMKAGVGVATGAMLWGYVVLGGRSGELVRRGGRRRAT